MPTPLARNALLSALSLAVLLTSCGEPSTTSDPAPSEEGASEIVHEEHAGGETCFICDETLRDAGRLWCREHDRYEDRCWICHPELEDKGRLYCREHGLYEDECSICRPQTPEATEDDDRSSDSGRHAPGDALFCNEHRVPELECGICQPQLATQLGPGDDLKVRFESHLSAAKAGIRTVAARSIEASANLGVVCEISYDENALARITPLAPGIVGKVLADAGAEVEPGDLLVEINSAEAAEAKAAYVSATVDLDLKDVTCKRERRLAERNIASDEEVQQAEAACRTAELVQSTARQRLLNLGFSEAEVDAIRDDRNTSASLFVRAPFAGTLVQRAAVVGEAVAPGSHLFTLADLGTMWLTLSLPADRASLVREGMAVTAVFRGSGVESEGVLTWVSTSIDEKSRMLRARAVVDNSGRSLRAGMFGEARIVLSAAETAVGIPRAALQLFEDNTYVFVKVEEDLYSLRRIEILDRPSEDIVAVVEGLQPDEPVVAEGSFTVMSEFLKSRLGAGCVDD